MLNKLESYVISAFLIVYYYSMGAADGMDNQRSREISLGLFVNVSKVRSF